MKTDNTSKSIETITENITPPPPVAGWEIKLANIPSVFVRKNRIVTFEEPIVEGWYFLRSGIESLVASERAEAVKEYQKQQAIDMVESGIMTTHAQVTLGELCKPLIDKALASLSPQGEKV